MKNKIEINKNETIHNEIAGILLSALAILILLSLISYQLNDYFLGIIGKMIGSTLFGTCSYGAYMLPLLIGVCSWSSFRGIVIKRIFLKSAIIVVLMLFICGLLNLIGGSESRLGGEVGNFIDDGLLTPLFGKVGSFIITFTFMLVLISLITGFSLKKFIVLTVALKKRSIERKSQIIIRKPDGTESNILIKKPKEKEEIKETKNEKHSPAQKEPKQKQIKTVNRKQEDYVFPSIELLENPEKTDSKLEQEDLNEKARTLEDTLHNFSISARVKNIYPGPVITRYDLELAPGVRVSSINSLSNDLALALQAKTIRILAPIPGKSAVGIEIPNKNRKTIYLKEILQSNAYKNSDSALTIALGKTVTGEDYVDSLTNMPHLLVAGATGSGKSVCLNTLISGILYKARTDEVKFIMIDPKMVELPVYNGIGHLISPVVTSVKGAVEVLGWSVAEMDRRYKKFAEHVKRDIFDFNVFARKTGEEEPIPFIVIIIDELADLMTMASKHVEKLILRLAQMSRAVGIHLVLATQRPSVDVITGIIKTNIPARIAFNVVSRVDSNIILDMGGAETLIGRGDMLYLPSGAPKPVRLQGGYITAQEIERVVNHIKSQKEPSYSNEIVDAIKKMEEGGGESKEEIELLKQACKLILIRNQASTSLFKGALHISDGKASNLISLLETKELIGPGQGSKPREVFMEKIEKYLTD